MKYYIANKDENEILLYEYKILKDKLYDYKKKKMSELENKLLNASFTIPYGYDYNFKDDEINYIRYNIYIYIYIYIVYTQISK